MRGIEWMTTGECNVDVGSTTTEWAVFIGTDDGTIAIAGSLDELDFFALRVRAAVQDARIARLTGGA